MLKNFLIKIAIKHYRIKIKSIANLSKDEATNLYLKSIKKDLEKENEKKIEELKCKSKKEIIEEASEILVQAMEQISSDIVRKNAVYSFTIDDPKLKGKLIGKDGRNIKTIEKVSNANLIFSSDDNNTKIDISCFNPIKRELALRLINRLIKSRAIEPSRIEKYYQEEKDNLNKFLQDKGKETVENILKIEEYIPKSIYLNIGRLHFRSSYSQNILIHSIECAKLAGAIAKQLGLNQKKAMASAFVHDIGKSQDYEFNNDHVDIGKKLAIEHNFDNFLINSIVSHHENEPINNIYSAIAKVVDIISSSRPGARNFSKEEFNKIIFNLESQALNIPGVKSAYAIRSGKEIRVITSDNIEDYQVNDICQKLKKIYENDSILNLKPINIIVIKELRSSAKTKPSLAQ
ncbi:MAG: HDIG domain-containing metalloprotein [Mycoplasmoidaceae bacterium]